MCFFSSGLGAIALIVKEEKPMGLWRKYRNKRKIISHKGQDPGGGTDTRGDAGSQAPRVTFALVSLCRHRWGSQAPCPAAARGIPREWVGPPKPGMLLHRREGLPTGTSASAVTDPLRMLSVGWQHRELGTYCHSNDNMAFQNRNPTLNRVERSGLRS